MPAFFSFFLCFVYVSRTTEKSKFLSFAFGGFLTGMAFLSRYNGVLVLPVLLILAMFKGGFSKPVPWLVKDDWKKGLAVLAGFVVSIFLAFLPSALIDPNHHSPFYFFARNLKVLASVQSWASHSLVLFAGKLWKSGSFLFFPDQFLLKNTIPFLVFIVLGFTLLGLRKIDIP